MLVPEMRLGKRLLSLDDFIGQILERRELTGLGSGDRPEMSKQGRPFAVLSLKISIERLLSSLNFSM